MVAFLAVPSPFSVSAHQCRHSELEWLSRSSMRGAEVVNVAHVSFTAFLHVIGVASFRVPTTATA